MKVEKKSDIYFVTNEEGGPFYIQWKNILIYYDDEVPMIEMGTTSKTINTNNFKRRSEEHTSELQSHSFISYAVFCVKKKKKTKNDTK